jgi:hypothetical protein
MMSVFMSNSIGIVALLLAPAVFGWLIGYTDVAHHAALGAVLAMNMCLLGRRIQHFSPLLPLVYVAAAVTAESTVGVAGLIVAVAAAVGAASSRGYHRALLSVLAAALLGSFEPGQFAEVAERGAAMLLGCVYGWLVAATVLRHVAVESLAVQPPTASGYAALLAVLVLTAWFVARITGLAHGWWLPLAAAAIGEPALLGSSRGAALRLASALCVAFALVTVVELIHDPLVRVLFAGLLLIVVFTVRPRTAAVQAMLLTPVAVALATRSERALSLDDYLGAVLLAALVVFVATLLGKWVLWTLRPDAGHATL